MELENLSIQSDLPQDGKTQKLLPWIKPSLQRLSGSEKTDKFPGPFETTSNGRTYGPTGS